MKKFSVLIPDGESYIMGYVINCFSMSKEIDVYIMSKSKSNNIQFSRHVKKFFYYKKTISDSDWIEKINRISEKYVIDVILPIIDYGIKKLIENKNSIKIKSVLLPSLEYYTIASDKGLLNNYLKQNNLPCPESIIITEKKLPDRIDLKFPIIVKPVIGYGGGKGIEVLRSDKEIADYYNTNTFKCKTIIQEFIHGYDICTNVLCKDGNILAYSIQKGSLFENGDLTYQIGFDFVENVDLLENLEVLMKSLNWSGVANIDWRFDENTNEFKIIEINTRYWYNTDASAIAGVNFPVFNCLSCLNIHFEKPTTKLISYFNLKGLIKKIKKSPFILLDYKFLKCQTPLFFAIKDPIPTVYKLIWRTKNIILSRKKS